MLEGYLRPVYQYLFVHPIVKLIYKWVTPLQVTISGCLIGIMVLPALYFGLVGVASIFLLVSGYLDTLDGSLARFNKKISPAGTVIDITSDRMVEFAVILGLFAVDPSQRGLGCLLILGSCFICVTSFLTVGIFLPNHSAKGFHYSPGLIERMEAFIFFLGIMWLPDLFFLLTVIFISLVGYTSYLRIKQFINYFQHVELPLQAHPSFGRTQGVYHG